MSSASWRAQALLVGAALLVALPWCSTEVAATDGPTAEEPGYRLDDYRAPTPATVPHGQAIDTVAAKAIWERGGAIWIDVLPAPRRPHTLGANAVWKPLPRRNIPGSVWLPDVGRGALNPGLERYFRDNLARLTAGERDAALVFYCLADCWMSWNATKRAAEYGYTNLYWYRDGTDGWEVAQLATAECSPVPETP
jgi:PQQ-dependent catabolism-associated CXXCW motif protein